MTDLYDEAQFDTIQKEYDLVQKYSKHIAEGTIRSMIVSGPPGVGKSHMVNQFLTEYGNAGSHRYLKGKITPLSLYDALHRCRKPKEVVILDDTDSIFKDAEGQNILKAVMDTSNIRQVDWASTTALLNQMKLPQSFKFEGGVVLITNIGFDGNLKSSIHLRAIKDRSFAIPIGADSLQMRFTMIAFMVLRKGMLDSFEFKDSEITMLLMHLKSNLEYFSTVSLRTMIKLANLYRLEPNGWREMSAALQVAE